MKRTLLFCNSLLLTAAALNAAPTLVSGVPGNSLLSTPKGPSPRFGTLINFDGLTPNTSFSAGTYASQGISSISSPDGLTVLPFSTQSSPNELFDSSSNGTANITISLSRAASEIGIGITDSDPVSITLEALNQNGTVFGSPFVVNLATTASPDPNNPFNFYYAVSDPTGQIWGLEILQNTGSANFSGLAIDDLQVSPEPASLALLAGAAILLGSLRFRKRA